MPKTAIIAIARILITAAFVFGFPYFLRQFLKHSDKRTTIIRIVLIAYIIAVIVITLGIRSYDNESGVITDLTWAYRQIYRTVHAGYEVGGLLEAIKRIHWVRGTVSSLILNVFLFVPYGIGTRQNEDKSIAMLAAQRQLYNEVGDLEILNINDDFERLKELDIEFGLTRNKSMSELQMIQKYITEHRKSAVKIPNAVYKLFKDNDEDREHRIATMDTEQQ